MNFSPPGSSSPFIEAVWPILQSALREIVSWALEALTAATGAILLNVEKQLHVKVAAQICDPLLGCLLRVAVNSPELAQGATELVSLREHSRLQDSKQKVQVRLLGGTLQSVVVQYFLIRAPRGKGRPTKKRGPNGNGFYPQLELLGIHGRVSPALASLAASQLARSPVEEALSVLNDQGIRLDSKTLTRIGQGVAQRALDFRAGLVDQIRSGERGRLCKGKRFAIAVDGGRIRTRDYKGRRRRSTRRRRFKGEWREPKVFVIYELDPAGRRDRKGLRIYEGTMGPADDCFELLAAYLCYIGAHEADEIVVVADGASWVWNRIENLLKVTGIDPAKVTEVVDFYHVAERFHDVAKTVSGWTEEQRQKWVKARLHQVRGGQLAEAMAACEELKKGRRAKAVAKLSKYFRNNEARMDYQNCRRRRLPMGSGAVESGIRRIINLRLKGNGIFWGIQNAEGLIHLRGHLLAGRWPQLVQSAILPKEHWANRAA
jgi:hypothetical protein